MYFAFIILSRTQVLNQRFSLRFSKTSLYSTVSEVELNTKSLVSVPYRYSVQMPGHSMPCYDRSLSSVWF